MSRSISPPPGFDPTTKTMVEAAPPDWVELFDQPMGATKVVDADIATTISGAADKVIRVGARPPYLLHLDFQAGHFSSRMLLSLHLRNVALQYRHGLTVITGLVLLKPEADSPRLTGVHHTARPGQEPETTFRYRVLRVWEQPPELFLRGAGTLPLAPVSAVTNDQIPEIIREVKSRLAGHPLAPDLWAAMYVMLGLRYSTAFASMILQGVFSMKESTTYQAIIAEGMAEGKALGKAEGALDQTRKLLLRLGSMQFGPPSKTHLAALKRINDLTRLEDLSERLLSAESWQDLLQANGPPSRRQGRS